MDFLESRYCRINRIIAASVGLWPYQNTLRSRIWGVFLAMTVASGALNQFASFITHEFSFHLFAKILSYSIPKFVYILKYITFAFNKEQIAQILNWIQADWKSLTAENEHNIIENRANKGRVITVLGIVIICPSLVAFVLSPFAPQFLDLIIPLNVSRTHKIPIVVEYFVDQKKYFYYILLHIDICDLIGASIVLATETTTVLFVQHACGLFEVVSYRIENAVENSILYVFHTKEDDVLQEKVRRVAILHQRSLDFSRLVRDTFTKYYFTLLIMGVLSLSINLYIFARALLVVTESEELLIALVLIVVHFGYMFHCNYIGQEMLDNSRSIFYNAYDTRWYMAPTPIRKLLLFVMQRSLTGCAFVTGGVFTPSYEGFSTLMSTSMSYFTVLFSMI